MCLRLHACGCVCVCVRQISLDNENCGEKSKNYIVKKSKPDTALKRIT